MEQSTNELIIDQGETPHSCCNVLLRSSGVSCQFAKSGNPTSTDHYGSAVLIHVPSSCNSRNSSLVYMSSELIQLKINLANHLVNSQLNLFPAAFHRIVE